MEARIRWVGSWVPEELDRVRASLVWLSLRILEQEGLLVGIFGPGCGSPEVRRLLRCAGTCGAGGLGWNCPSSGGLGWALRRRGLACAAVRLGGWEKVGAYLRNLFTHPIVW